jgi:hypothetical protein
MRWRVQQKNCEFALIAVREELSLAKISRGDDPKTDLCDFIEQLITASHIDQSPV